MTTKSSMSGTIQTKVINATAKIVPMNLQIRALKVLMKAKRKTIGPKTPMLHFVESPLPDVTTLSIEEIDASNPFLYRQGKCSAYFKRLLTSGIA